ncbi:restriction endonuclease [Sphingopyxis sp. 550A]
MSEQPHGLTPEQSAFLSSFVERNDPRTLLVAPPGSGKTSMARIAAMQLLLEGAIDRVLLAAGTRMLAEQWRKELPAEGRALESIADRITVATYAGLSANPDDWLADQSPGTKWLLVFEDVEWDAGRADMLAADALARFPGSRALFIATDTPPLGVDTRFTFNRELFGRDALGQPAAQSRLRPLAPSIGILEKVSQRLVRIDELGWRDFERLIAQMLEAEGYQVELMQGSKDGGVDVVAVKNLEGIGLLKSVWQAKKHRIDRKVGLSMVRELADTRIEHGASKAIIVTTSFLTSGALARVERDRYQLGKVDRDELDDWIARTLRG